MKLSYRQQEVVDKLRAGWTLKMGPMGPWMDHPELASVDVHRSTFFSLVDHRVIVLVSDSANKAITEWGLGDGYRSA